MSAWGGIANIPLELRLSRHTVPLSKSQRADSMYGDVPEPIRTAVFERDHHTCRCCGFRCLKYQQVVVRDGNLRDIDNMFTACMFCHQCFHLDLVAKTRSGVLVWLPEVDQASLHHAARDIYLARITSGPAALKARRLLHVLLASDETPDLRRQQARERLGTDDPAALVERLRNAEPEPSRSSWKEALGGIRLLPLDRRIVREDDLEFNLFPQVLAYWRSRDGPFHGERAYRWLRYLERKLPRVPLAQLPEAESAPPEKPYTEVAAGLLRDAATFFRKLADQNPPLTRQMDENAEVFEKLAGVLEQNSGVAEPAAKLLRDAASFFVSLGEQNPPLQEQMVDNARVYRQVAQLLETDPTGKLI